MRIIPALLLAGLAIVYLSSCQKEVDPSTLNPLINDSNYVKQCVVIDTTEVSGADTLLKYQFQYDGSGRLDKYTCTIYNPGVSGAGRLDYQDEYQYAYSSSDSVPSKTQHRYSDFVTPSSNYVDTFYISYQNGFITKDSLNENPGYLVYTYTPIGTNRYKTLEKYVDALGNASYDTARSYVNWVNGNLMFEADSLWIPSLSIWDEKVNLQFTYDNKPNPFRRIALRHPTPASTDILASFDINLLAFGTTNNILTIDDGTGADTFTYTYGSNGMPLIGRYTDGAVWLKFIYQYTHL
jgi:hypothetical protein